MNEMIKTPEFLFESSWEVCNKVGGIYTVLSTKAHTLQQIFNDKVIFIGPDVWANTTAPDFTEDASLFEDWRKHAEAVDHLKVKVGRWNVPGTPPVILVDFKSYFSERDAFFYSMWENFRVDSIHAYGDYDESCIFAYAVGKVISTFLTVTSISWVVYRLYVTKIRFFIELIIIFERFRERRSKDMTIC